MVVRNYVVSVPIVLARIDKGVLVIAEHANSERRLQRTCDLQVQALCCAVIDN